MTFSDIPELAGLLGEAHRRANYDRFGPYDEAKGKAFFMQAIQRNGGMAAGGTFCAVADRGGIEAFIIGILQPIYHVMDALEATDLFWYARENAHAESAVRLLKQMHKWAVKCPDVKLIRHANTNAIVDPRLSGELLKRYGMQQTGFVYERGVPR
jgi:hypothetical protein